jgi:lipoprotein-releasing system permease protein
VSLIALISLLGIILGTLVQTVVMSVMSGFQEDLRARLLAFTPQVTVERADHQSWNSAALRAKIAALPEVEAVAPFVSSQVMAVSNTASGVPGYVSGGILRGVTARNNTVLAELKRTLQLGSLDSLARPHRLTIEDHGKRHEVELPGAIVGRTLAFDLGLQVGDPMILVSPASLTPGIGGPRLKRFVVTGYFYSGMYDFDSTLIFADLKDARALLADDPQLESGLELRLHNMFDAPEVARKIAAMAGPGFQVSDWTRANAPLFSALSLEKLGYFVVLLLIVVVAGFNIIATLSMVVIERRKEIAILRAMGARAGSIAWVFLCEGVAIGAAGTLIGVGFGLAISWAIGRFHLIHLPPDLFIVSAVPVRLYPLNFLAVGAAALALCVAASLYPALHARSLSPVEVIRYE